MKKILLILLVLQYTECEAQCHITAGNGSPFYLDLLLLRKDSGIMSSIQLAPGELSTQRYMQSGYVKYLRILYDTCPVSLFDNDKSIWMPINKEFRFVMDYLVIVTRDSLGSWKFQYQERNFWDLQYLNRLH